MHDNFVITPAEDVRQLNLEANQFRVTAYHFAPQTGSKVVARSTAIIVLTQKRQEFYYIAFGDKVDLNAGEVSYMRTAELEPYLLQLPANLPEESPLIFGPLNAEQANLLHRFAHFEALRVASERVSLAALDELAGGLMRSGHYPRPPNNPKTLG